MLSSVAQLQCIAAWPGAILKLDAEEGEFSSAAGARMDLVIFDLDGTLIDSRKDLVNAVNATRAHMGMPPLADDTVASYIGNGAPVLIRRALGQEATEEQVKEALEYFIEYYRDHALDYTKLYDGVQPSLARLAAAGIHMAVLTNKPVRISRMIVEGLGVATSFGQVYGGNSFDFKKPNPIGIQKLMEEFGAARNRTLMVGDSSVDILTARNAQVKSCGVTYGFQPETLTEPRPDLLVDRMEQLADWVLSNRNGGSQ
jgi:phosphoglycolate phosphatase